MDGAEAACVPCGVGELGATTVRHRSLSVKVWDCPTHRACGSVRTPQGGMLTVRSGDTPSATVSRWVVLLGRANSDLGEVMFRDRQALLLWAEGRPLSMDAETARLFCAYGMDRTVAEAMLSLGVKDVVTAQRWLYLIEEATSPEAVVAFVKRWKGAGFPDPRDVRPWLQLGVEDPRVALSFESPAQAVFTKIARVPFDPAWGALAAVVAPEFAAVGHKYGQAPAAIALLGQALERRRGRAPGRKEPQRWNGVPYQSPWTADERRDWVVTGGSIGAVNWADVAQCLDAGLDIGKARGHVFRGQEMDSIRVMAALRR